MAKSPKQSGFEEAPQAPYEGAPLSDVPFEGNVSDWVRALEREAEKGARAAEMRTIRSEAGKHRLRAEKGASNLPPDGGGRTEGPGGGEMRRVPSDPSPAGVGGGTRRRKSSAIGEKRSGGGTLIGGVNDPKQRAAAGLNPVAGLDVSLEEAAALGATGAVTATVEALAALIESGNPLHKNGQMWTPHRPERPEKSEGGIAFRMVSPFEPSGDQPRAIRDLVEGLGGAGPPISPLAGEMPGRAEGGLRLPGTHPPLSASPTSPPQGGRLAQGERTQVLLGVTGSGKTFTMAKVIEETGRPALILAPNKTLAAQLYGEMKGFFPDNAVEYFVSYYDYYQPEAYVPRTDTYIEKESSVNEQIDRMRHSATRALLERDDVIIVASVSCIYGIGSVETYTAMTFAMSVGDRIDQRQLLADLVAQQYKRAEADFRRGTFRVRGDTIEIFPAHLEDRAWRIALFGDEIESIAEFDPLTGRKSADLKSVKVYANSHYVTPKPTLAQATASIKAELKERLAELERGGRLLEAQRLAQRTQFDLEMLEATGSCAGIENYSRYLTGRQPGEPPPTLFEYVPDNAIVFIDESHVTIPQIGGMYRGDFRRKATLAEYGFRLPSCMDNRPLRFEEWDAMRPATIAVSATPGEWEMEQAGGVFAEQVIRPTGLVDPPVEVRPAKTQVDDALAEIRATSAKGYRTLVTVLTKRMAEDLTEYLHEQGVRVRYMHSDIDTLERIEIIRDLRLGAFDVLVGINLLREGLDIPECALVAILDADKEGFLRSETSLIQTIGRAARNVDGKVVLYADHVTGSMERAMAETSRRRDKQMAWNAEHGITPESVKKNIADILDSVWERDHVRASVAETAGSEGALVGANLAAHLEHLEKAMREAAADLDFETAARLRDEIKRLKAAELAAMDDPLAMQPISPLAGEMPGRAEGGGRRKRRPPLSPLDKLGTTSPPQGGRSEGGLFRKPHLDEMTVGRTEQPLPPKGWAVPEKPLPSTSPLWGGRAEGAGGGVKAPARRRDTPTPDPSPQGGGESGAVRRERVGQGSYEDPADARRQKRRPGKTGRPGR